MLTMRPSTILRYLHHAQAVEAHERLGLVAAQAVPMMRGAEQSALLHRWRLQAAGLEEREIAATIQTENEMRWAQNWDRLRGRLGGHTLAGARGRGPRLAPGERIVVPGE